MKTIIRTPGECCKEPLHKQSMDEFKTVFCENCYSVISYTKSENEISDKVKAVKIKFSGESISYGFVEKHFLHDLLEKKHKYHFIPKIDTAFAMTKKGNAVGCVTTEEDKIIGNLIINKKIKFNSQVINRLYIEKNENLEIIINKFTSQVKEGTLIVSTLDDVDTKELKAIQPSFLYLGKFKDIRKGKGINKDDKKHVFVKLIGIEEKNLTLKPTEFVFTEKNENANQISLFDL